MEDKITSNHICHLFKFLIDKKSLRRFMCNISKDELIESLPVNWNKYVFSSFFVFNKTPEGLDYWFNINTEYSRYLQENPVVVDEGDYPPFKPIEFFTFFLSMICLGSL